MRAKVTPFIKNSNKKSMGKNKTKNAKKILFSLILRQLLGRKKEPQKMLLAFIKEEQRFIEHLPLKGRKEVKEGGAESVQKRAQNIKKREERFKKIVKINTAQIKKFFHSEKFPSKSVQKIGRLNHPLNIKAVVESVKTALRNGATSLLLRLKAEGMGTMIVRFLLREDAISARFFVESPLLRRAIEEGIPYLREAFKDAGLCIEELGVSFGGGGGWHTFAGNHKEEEEPFSSFLEKQGVDILA